MSNDILGSGKRKPSEEYTLYEKNHCFVLTKSMLCVNQIHAMFLANPYANFRHILYLDIVVVPSLYFMMRIDPFLAFTFRPERS